MCARIDRGSVFFGSVPNRCIVNFTQVAIWGLNPWCKDNHLWLIKGRYSAVENAWLCWWNVRRCFEMSLKKRQTILRLPLWQLGTGTRYRGGNVFITCVGNRRNASHSLRSYRVRVRIVVKAINNFFRLITVMVVRSIRGCEWLWLSNFVHLERGSVSWWTDLENSPDMTAVVKVWRLRFETGKQNW